MMVPSLDHEQSAVIAHASNAQVAMMRAVGKIFFASTIN
jgi:hypothetical protein